MNPSFGANHTRSLAIHCGEQSLTMACEAYRFQVIVNLPTSNSRHESQSVTLEQETAENKCRYPCAPSAAAMLRPRLYWEQNQDLKISSP
jgi:hypothetical protein